MAEPISRFSSAVVVHNDGEKILLHKRADIRIWSLPGGGIENGESPEQTAVRETREETGFEIEIDRFIGEYHRPQIRDVRYVYQGHVTGGAPVEKNAETVKIGWFLKDHLPGYLEPDVREIVSEVFSDVDKPILKEMLIPPGQAVALRMMRFLSQLHHRLQDMMRKEQ